MIKNSFYELPEEEDRLNPSYYKKGERETIDHIKDITGENFEGYLVGNIVKYVSRYREKNGVEDLKKAQWYLESLISLLEDVSF